MNHSKKLLFQIYQKFYQQKGVLQTAPALAIDINQTNIENFDTDLADTEIRALISFLLGVQDVSQIPWENALELVEKYYNNQPQWKRLILHYFAYVLEKEKEQIHQEQIAFLNDLLIDLESEEEEEEDISNSTVLS